MPITCATVGSSFSFGRQRCRGGRVRRQHVDAVRVGQRIVDQVAQRAHRLGVRVLACRSGSESNASRGETASASDRQQAATTQDRLPPAHHHRIEPGRPGEADLRALRRGGRNTVIAAGRKVIVQMKAISMPAPAISPSSATPMKAGRHEGQEAGRGRQRRDQDLRCRPAARSAASPRPGRDIRTGARGSAPRTGWRNRPRCRRTARRSRPTPGSACRPRPSANSSVSISPSTSVSRIGTISRQVCTARNSHSVISTTLPIRPSTAPWATEANSSSASATCPVMRTRASPPCTNGKLGDDPRASPSSPRRPAAARRNPGAAAPARSGTCRPGRTGRRPAGVCQDSGCGWPSSASAIA